VALGDFDIAYKFQRHIPGAMELLQTPHAIGNAMWRSPEGQTGRGMSKASDIFSFGLMVGEPYLNARISAKALYSAYMLLEEVNY
jgi:hypothetical protein